MPKIKLIKVHDVGTDCYNCGTSIKDIVFDDMSPWQEVTEEELQWLQTWEGRSILQKKNTYMVILEDITSKETVDGFIQDIKAFVKEQEIKEEERKRKYIEAEKKRKATAEKKKIEKAKKLLEKSGIKIT